MSRKNDTVGYAEKVAEGGFLTVSQAGELLGLSRSKMYKLMDCGELPYCQMGGTRRLPRCELLDYIERNMKQ